MDITCVADLHGHYPKLDGGDLLIVAGDLTATGSESEFFQCFNWIYEQRYHKKILISGNHDQRMQHEDYRGPLGTMSGAFDYLCDSGTEFEGLKIWGSPWTPWFKGVNPKCTAFMLKSEEELAAKFALIPDDTDILVTHGPPRCIYDSIGAEHVGCGALLHARKRLKRLQLHTFGHIHEWGGNQMKHTDGATSVNCSHVDVCFDPINAPVRVVL